MNQETLTPGVRREYARLRGLDWTASSAYRAARVHEAFEAAEADGLVRFEAKVDECADLDELVGDEATEEERAQIAERCERDGVWGIVSEYLVAPCTACGAQERWEVADSVWGFVGADYEDSGYDVDVKASALEKIGRGL